MQDELVNAISTARSFIQKLSKPLNLGSVVKHSNGDIGIVFGIKAPDIFDDLWSYCVYWVQIEGAIATECDDLIEAWVDADAIEEIPQAPPMPQSQPSNQLPCIQWMQIGGESATENYDFIDSCQSWVDDKIE